MSIILSINLLQFIVYYSLEQSTFKYFFFFFLNMTLAALNTYYLLFSL